MKFDVEATNTRHADFDVEDLMRARFAQSADFTQEPVSPAAKPWLISIRR